MDNDIVQKVQQIADELSVRGTRLGHVGTGTQQRAGELRRNLLALYNAEKTWHTTTEFFKSEEYEENGERCSRLIPDKDRKPVRLPLPNNVKGEIIEKMIEHLMAAVWGKDSFSPEQKEQAILAAAKAIPELCDKLQAMPDSSVLSPNKSENEGTTEGTKNITSGDTADNSEKKSKRKFCDKCKRLKENWLNKIRRTKEDIPLQTFLKEFFANPALPDIWKKNGRGEKKPTTWEAMEKKFRANENDWKPEYTALIEELRGTLGGH
jgi:predicted metal-dependent hydrolase